MTPRHKQPKLPDEGNEQQARRARLRQSTGNRSGRILLAAGVVCVSAILTGVSLAVFSSPVGQTSGGVGANKGLSASPVQPAQSQAPVTVGVSTTGPGITSAGIAKTALQPPPSLNHQILHWREGSGGVAWSAVTSELGNAMQAGGVRLYPQLRQACASLLSSVKTAQAAPPIPDSAMQRMYAKVLAGLSGAAADCRDAISVRPEGDEGLSVSLNRALLNRALAELAVDSRTLYTATAEIGTLRR